MTWLLTSEGRDHHLVAPHATHPSNVPSLREIAHSLAHINRFTGHASRAYSVAEHSLLVADMVHAAGLGPEAELCALMHDAHECITGDVASPIKQVLGQPWADFEDGVQAALLAHYLLTDPMDIYAGWVKHYDLKALATERRDLMPFDASVHAPWPVIDTPGAEIRPWADAALMQPSCVLRTPGSWAQRFVNRFEALTAAEKVAA